MRTSITNIADLATQHRHPSPAAAATTAFVERQGQSVVYDGGVGNANAARFLIENGELTVTDRSAQLSAGNGCRIVEVGEAAPASTTSSPA